MLVRERLIHIPTYTAIVKLCNKHEITHGKHLIGLLPRSFLASTIPHKTSIVIVFSPSRLRLVLIAKRWWT